MRKVRTVGTDYTGHKILCCPVCAHEWNEISGSTCDWCDLGEGGELFVQIRRELLILKKGGEING